jgi:hypothetical protein
MVDGLMGGGEAFTGVGAGVWAGGGAASFVVSAAGSEVGFDRRNRSVFGMLAVIAAGLLSDVLISGCFSALAKSFLSKASLASFNWLAASLAFCASSA